MPAFASLASLASLDSQCRQSVSPSGQVRAHNRGSSLSHPQRSCPHLLALKGGEGDSFPDIGIPVQCLHLGSVTTLHLPWIFSFFVSQGSKE